MYLLDQLFIHQADVPANAIAGEYHYGLVFLSYVVAVVASYTALGIAADLRGDNGYSERIRLMAGVFSMGGGIWSMHFIGMIAYDTDMALSYSPVLTAVSMVLAMLFAAGAFMVVRHPVLTFKNMALAAPFLGVGVAAMHYTGMAAMEMDGTIQYTPGLFVASIGVGIAASAAALEIMHFSSRKALSVRRKYLVVAALVMGVAVCGLHYTAMAATVIIPDADCRWDPDASFEDLGVIIALIMGLVLFIAYLADRLEKSLAEVEDHTKSLISMKHNELVVQIVGGFAHEFNNVLAAIIANTEEAMDAGRSGDGAIDKQLQKVLARANEASELTSSLLGFSQQKNLAPVKLDVNSTLCKMNGILQYTLGDHISLVLKTSPDMCFVHVDPGEFKNAVMNLVMNARDALGDTGAVTIQTERLFMAGDMLRNKLPSGHYVAISVVDDGPGIPVEIREHVIDPFFTTKDVGKGAGMGLSVVHGFATQSGGTLDFYSEVGKGTTFTIYLPALENEKKGKRNQRDIGAALGDETVLVVEDDDDIRRYITRIARELGYTVFKASSVRAAKGLVKKGLQADLILCDAHLQGGESGVDFAAWAQSEMPEICIVIMSGMSGLTSEDRKKIRNDYLFVQKPFSQELLGTTIRTAIDRRDKNND